MSSFLKSPIEEKALLMGSDRRFGVIPKPAVRNEEIEVIVEYIKDNQLEKPKWFDEHHKGENTLYKFSITPSDVIVITISS